MTLIVKYDRINFFGHREYTEDMTAFCCKKNLIKAFSFLSKEKDAAIELDDGESVTLFWDSYRDFENRILSMNYSKTWNDEKISKVAFEKAKKTIYEKIGG